MRFLATGDLQCHAWRQFSYTMPNGMNSRLYNCLKVFKIIRREAKARGIKRVLLNGDIFEENAFINVDVYTPVYDQLEKLYRAGLDVVINLGNHDVLRQSGGRTLNALRPFRKVATVVEEPTLVWDRLQVVPWMADPKSLKNAIHELDASRKRCLVLHCGIQGARTGPNSYLVRNPLHLKDIRADRFGLVLLSDYHTFQKLSDHVFYLGSPLQHSFGEIHNPCIWDIECTDRAPYFDPKKIHTGLPQFKRIHLGSREIEALEKHGSDFAGHYIRVELPSDSRVSDQQIEELAAGRYLVQIERKGSKDRGHTNVVTLAPEEAISRYVKSHGRKSSRRRLVKLGNRIYRGEA